MTSTQRRMPDYIGIGTQRCGSSWIHGVLGSHPEIGKPANGLHYFSKNAHLGKDWYQDCLAPFSEKPVLLEYSVSYLYPEYCATTAETIKKEAPEAKIFLCVRDPAKRAFSDYLRSIRTGDLPADMSFIDAVRAFPELLERGRYARLLAPYLDAVPADRIKIFIFEDIEENPFLFAENLAAYFNLKPIFSPEKISRKEPKGRTIRSAMLNRLIWLVKNSVDNVFLATGLSDAWSAWKDKHVYRYERLLDLTHREAANELDYMRELTTVLLPDIELIEKLTGRTLSNWRIP